MTEPSMFSGHPDAVNAWASIGAAVGTVATAAFLTFDRIWTSQSLEAAATTSPSADGKHWATIHLRSRTGERVRVERVWATHGVAIAGAPRSYISRKNGEDQIGGWSGSCPLSGLLSEGAEDPLELYVYFRDDRSARRRLMDRCLGRRPTLRITGYFPFRTKGRRVSIRAALQAGR